MSILSEKKLKSVDDLMPGVTGTGAVPYSYESIKCPEYESLINGFFKALKSVSKPEFLQIAGIPGAGKSTFINDLNMPNYMIIGFDRVMAEMKSYKSDVEKFDLKTAFGNNELPARIIGYELIVRAVNEKLNIIFEHSGTLKNHFDMIKNLNVLGYKTTMKFIECPLNVALQRVKDREVELQRYTPPKLVKDRYNMMPELLENYNEIFNKINVIKYGEHGNKK